MRKQKKNIKERSKKYEKEDNTHEPGRISEMTYYNGTYLSINTTHWAHGHPTNSTRATNITIDLD